jgi:hypothetical protein
MNCFGTYNYTNTKSIFLDFVIYLCYISILIRDFLRLTFQILIFDLVASMSR